MGLLDEILAQKAAEADDARAALPRSRDAALGRRDVVGALRRPPGEPLRVIAEIKFRSPSAGALSRRLGPADRAEVYERAGAAMVSVLTDERWFGGSLDDLSSARERVALPVLCKDFLVDPAQVEHIWAAGADAALIIVRCLRKAPRVRALVDHMRHLGLEPFVEVVNEDELAMAIDAGARVIGVNARDLETLALDIDRAHRVLACVPRPLVAVHLSGIQTAHDTAEVAASRADAVLVGEALMRVDDPESLLLELTRAAGGLNSRPA